MTTYFDPVLFGWCWILAGLLLGVGLGTRFHRPDWLGGYASWPRRLLRLAHVAFIALGALNVLHGLRPTGGPVASALLALGAVTMPLVCLGAAWKPPLRALFPIPVISCVAAVILVIVH